MEVLPDGSSFGPFWQNLPYECTVPESAPIGSLRNCVAYAWTADNHSVTYQLHDVLIELEIINNVIFKRN